MNGPILLRYGFLNIYFEPVIGIDFLLMQFSYRAASWMMIALINLRTYPAKKEDTCVL
jgi:hypothetical protein